MQANVHATACMCAVISQLSSRLSQQADVQDAGDRMVADAVVARLSAESINAQLAKNDLPAATEWALEAPTLSSAPVDGEMARERRAVQGKRVKLSLALPFTNTFAIQFTSLKEFKLGLNEAKLKKSVADAAGVPNDVVTIDSIQQDISAKSLRFEITVKARSEDAIKVYAVDIGHYAMDANYKPGQPARASSESIVASMTCGLLGGAPRLPPHSRIPAELISRTLVEEFGLAHKTRQDALFDALASGKSKRDADKIADQAEADLALGRGLDKFEVELRKRENGWQGKIVRTMNGSASVKDDRRLAAAAAQDHVASSRLWNLTAGMLQADFDASNPLRSTVLQHIAH